MFARLDKACLVDIIILYVSFHAIFVGVLVVLGCAPFGVCGVGGGGGGRSAWLWLCCSWMPVYDVMRVALVLVLVDVGAWYLGFVLGARVMLVGCISGDVSVRGSGMVSFGWWRGVAQLVLSQCGDASLVLTIVGGFECRRGVVVVCPGYNNSFLWLGVGVGQ